MPASAPADSPDSESSCSSTHPSPQHCDHNRRRKRFRRTLYLFARFLYLFTPWLAHLILSDLALSALLPAATVLPSLAYNIASRIAESVWRSIQRIVVENNGAAIILSGDQLPIGESAIVVSNHVEWSDFYMIQALALRSGMLGRCRWFAKQQLKWVPLLGWGLRAMGMPLVSRKWTEDSREMSRVFRGIINKHWPIWLISFSEATRFTTAKHAETVAWCQANNKTPPRYTLHPRVKGFIATVQNLRNAKHVKAVYDITIAYAHKSRFMSPPSFLQTLYEPDLAKSYRTYAHVRRFDMASLPHSDHDLTLWLEERWTEKNQILDDLNQKLIRGENWGQATVPKEKVDTNGHH